MALTFHSGLEMGTAGEWSAVTGSPSINSTTKNTGTYSLRCNTASTTAYVDNGLADGSMDRGSFYLYIATLPNATSRIVGDATGAALYLTGTADKDKNETPGAARQVYGVNWAYTYFKASASYTILSIALSMYRLGSPGTVTVSIMAIDGDSKPTGEALCSGTTDGDTIAADPGEWRLVTLGSGTALTSGTTYAVVVRAPSGSGLNKLQWYYGAYSADWGGGYSTDSGSTWTVQTAEDYHIRTYSASTGPGTIDYYTGGTRRSGGAAVVPLSTWTRISWATDGTTFKTFINGTQDISNAVTVDEVADGTIGVITTATADLYFDDIVFDNTSTTSDIGNIKTAPASIVNGAGTYANFDTVVPAGTTHWTTYNDGPGALNTTDYVMHAAKTVVADIGALTNCTTDLGLSTTDTIQAVSYYIYSLLTVATTSYGMRVRSGTTDYDTTKSMLTTPAWYNVYYANSPSGGTWTQALFDATECGAKHSGVAPDMYMFDVMAMVAYTPGSATSGTAYEGMAADYIIWNTPLGRGNASFQNAQLDKMVGTNPSGRGNAGFQNSQLQNIITSDLSRFGLSYTNTNVESLRTSDNTQGSPTFNNAQLDKLVSNDLSRGHGSFQNQQLDNIRTNDLSKGNASFQNTQLDNVRGNDLSRGNLSAQNTQLDKIVSNDLSRMNLAYFNAQLDSLRTSDTNSTSLTMSPTLTDKMVSNDLSKGQATFYTTQTDSIVTVANPRTLVNFNNSQIDKLVFNDLSKGSATFESTVQDILAFWDLSSLAGAGAYLLSIVETMAVSDITKGIVNSQDAVRDAIIWTDTVLNYISFSPTQTDKIVTADLSKLNTAYYNAQAEYLRLNDDDTISLTLNPSQLDNIRANDLSKGQRSSQNSQLDSIVTSDLSKGQRASQNTQLDKIVTNDLSRQNMAYNNAQLDSMRMSDNRATNNSFQNSQLDTTKITDSDASNVNFYNIQIDKVVSNDLSKGNAGFQNTQLDNVRFTDGSFFNLTLSPSVLEAIRLYDFSFATASSGGGGGTTYYHEILESLKLTDVQLTSVSFMNAAQDLLKIIDNDSLSISFYNKQLDTVIYNDLSKIYNSQGISVTQNAIFYDLSKVMNTCQMSITDSVVLNDTGLTQVSFVALATDSVQLVDAIATAVNFYSAVFDEVILSDLTIREGAKRIYYITFKLNLRTKTFKAHNHSLTMKLPARGFTWEIHNRNLTVQSKNKNITFTLGG